MGGLLTRVVGGALTGAGSAMVDQAKAAREEAIAALKRGQAVEDRDAGFAHQDTLQQNQFGHDDTSQQAGFTHADASQKAGFAHEDTSQQAGFAHQDTITDKTIKAEGDRNAATIAGQKDIAKMRTDSYNAKTASIASQYGTKGALTYNQALQTARQAYKDQVAQGGTLTDGDGTPIPSDKAIADIADQLMAKNQAAQPAQTTVVPSGGLGGGLTSNLFGGAPPALSFPSSPSPTPASPPAPQSAAPPTGFKQGSDGGYYAPDPKRPGKFLKWTP